MPALAQTITKDIRSYWLDPEAAFKKDAKSGEPNPFEPQPVAVTAQHLALLRQSVLAWDGAEIGAPEFDRKKPFGRTDLLKQIGESFGVSKARQIARKHVETMFALGALLQHGELAPGRYAMKNVAIDELRKQLPDTDKGPPSSADLGLSEGGAFYFKDTHRTLLRNMLFAWPGRSDVEEYLEIDWYPFARFDPKRPYGDFTYYQAEMALHLGRRDILKQEADGAWLMSEGHEQALMRLHWQMVFALQVFLENAELKPGTYSWAKP